MNFPWINTLFFAPLVASLCIGLLASVMGVFIFVRKRALLSETLSHAAFPGVAVAALFSFTSPIIFTLITVISSLLGYALIDFFKKKGSLSDDSALTFVLVGFFAIAVTLFSLLQQLDSSKIKLISSTLYGQIGWVDDKELVFIFTATLIVLSVFFLFYKEFKLISFDRELAKLAKVEKWDLLFSLLVAVTLALGIRLCGTLLISALLIAPAISARKFTDRLSCMILLSSLFSFTSIIVGTFCSYKVESYSLPIGPTIVLVSSALACFSLLFSKRGVVFCFIRKRLFHFRCLQENLLKTLWKAKEDGESIDDRLSAKKLKISLAHIKLLFFYFYLRGWIDSEKRLSSKGERLGGKIVRLHRLWETYLVELGISKDLVHPIAEEMEHILNADFEKELGSWLDHPKLDPHQKPIPKRLDESNL